MKLEPGTAWWRSPWWWLAALGGGFGIWLRVAQLRDQFLIDDEWHAVGQVLHSSIADIVTHFGTADYSIPLTLYYRWLYELGALSEWNMRLPLLLAGLALVALVPWLLRGFAAVPARALTLVLLAISPTHVYLSRTARPYALLALLTMTAIVAFRRWWHREPHARACAAGYAVATVLAGWLHVLSLVFTLVPFLYFGIPVLWRLFQPARRANAWTDLRRLVVLALLVALPLTGLLLPPFINDWAALTSKAGVGASSWESVWRSLLMLFGTGSSLVGAALTALALAGLARVWRRDREAAAYPLCIGVLGLAVILVAQPAWIGHPGVLVRYALPLLPWLLWWLAEGITGWPQSSPRAPWRVAIAAIVAVALFVQGPIPERWYRPNQLMGSPRFQFDYDPAHNPYRSADMLPDQPMPAFFAMLATLPPQSVTVAIAPWSILSWSLPQTWYQQTHQQMLKAALLDGVCETLPRGDWPESARGMAMRNYVHLAAILRGETEGVDYLVLRGQYWGFGTETPAVAAWPDLADCLPRVRAALGAPVYRDNQIVVFTVAR